MASNRSRPLTRPRIIEQGLLKKLLLSLVATGFSGLVLVGGAEVYLRLFDDHKYQPRPALFVDGGTTGPAVAANLDCVYFGQDYSLHIRTDKHGYRRSRRPLADGEPLVLLVGDSYTFGWGVSDDQTYASYLDGALVEQGLRVINLGTPGFGTLEYAQRLEQALGEFAAHPIRAIVVLHVDNDPVDNVEEILRLNGFLAHRADPHYINPGPSRALNALDRMALRLAPLEWLVETGKSQGKLTYEGVDLEQSFEDLSLAREYASKGKLTPFQARLVQLGVERLDRQAKEANVPILHWVLPALPNNGSGLQATLAQSSRRYLGELKAEWGSEPIHNSNSAGHYTPGFNQALAQALLSELSSRASL